MSSAGADAAERARIRAEFERRAREIRPDRYAPWQAAQQLVDASRRRVAAQMLKRAGSFPSPGDPVLDVGCGPLGWLSDFIGWGLRESDLHGVDVDDARLAVAQAALPGADLRVADATALPFAAESFRVVVTATVFSSILDKSVRGRVAAEIERVLRPGGALLWHDFAFNNPFNAHVRGVRRAELRALFPGLAGEVRRVTLAPPIARVVAPRSYTLATVLEAMPVLRTHLLAVLVKQ